MIVVGTSHRGALGGVWAGSATEQVLHGAPAAVAVAPGRLRADGRADQRCCGAIGVASTARRSRRRRCPRGRAGDGWRARAVVPVSIVDLRTPGTIAYGYEQYIDAVRELATLEAGARPARPVRASGDVESIKREGDPASELAHVSGEVDLLVAGSRGYGPLKRVLLGSVTTRLRARGGGPLLLLPRSAADADEQAAGGGAGHGVRGGRRGAERGGRRAARLTTAARRSR